jgi:hypothetical protein
LVRRPAGEILVDKEEFDIIMLMVPDFLEGPNDYPGLNRLMGELERQGYEHFRAKNLAI